ncbi:MAG: cob(I)yrinic acid a,c-diamide adenosyltransferase [Elusimicrobia bacterium]|nr:cob(I)yrinic acid a,c-diamide adenosyltransferase [Elusimicrobiota bacterium]
MKIYTKTGDKGQTGLRGGTRVSKADPRVAAYGEVDELNAVLGLAAGTLPRRRAFAQLRLALEKVQGELFQVGAALSAPAGSPEEAAFKAGTELRLEAEIDRMSAALPPLANFILPGGVLPAAGLHQARAVCRRAERAVVGLGTGAPPAVVLYLNRLSDFLFVCARWANNRLRSPETRWKAP